jgi:16S rRNA (cytidine1402-2'-O)-methyltransferase
VLGLLQDIEAVFGNRRMALCREMTKKFEETVYGDIREVIQKLGNKKCLGEFTFVVEGNREQKD